MKSIEDKLLGQLYCFCGGGDDTGGGSAGDFDDSYNQAMGYTDTLGGPGRSDDSGNARQTTAEERAAAPGYDSQIEAAARDLAEYAGRDDYTDVFAGNIDAYNEMQSRLSAPEPEARVVSETLLGPELQRVDPLIQEAIKQQRAPRTTVTDYEGDIFAMDGMADPFQTMQMTAPVNIPGAPETTVSPGSPNDIRNRENIVRNNIDLETGLPVSVRQANAPTFNTVPNYDETDYLDMGQGLSLVGARQKAVSDLKSRAGEKELFDTGIGYGILDNILNSTLRPDQMSQEMLDKRGQAVYSVAPDQGIVAVVDPKTGNIQPTSGNFFNRELNPVYDQYNRTPEGDSGGDQQAAPAVTAPVAPATCPPGYRFNEKTNACEYVGQVYPGAAPYSGQPITASTQYTGIGGLSPFVLQPSYTSQTPFAPLYNVG